MSCASIMTKSPVTIREHESVGEAAAKLVSNHVTGLPVVDAQDRYIGMFGVYELLSLLVPRIALAGDVTANLRFISDDPEELRRKYQEVKSRPVSEVANRDAPTLGPDSPEVEAIRLLCRNIAALAVVDRNSGRAMGTLSGWDAIRALAGPA